MVVECVQSTRGGVRMNKIMEPSKAFFGAIGRFFREFGTSVAKGDLFVKLSLIWMGAGYIRRKQIIKGILMTLLEAAVILFSCMVSTQYIPKFGTLGTVQQESVFNIVTMQSEFNTRLLFGIYQSAS